MHLRSRRIATVIAVALVTALAGVHEARAAGAVNINACQTLSGGGTTYKLTADLTSCDNCLVVAANKITIDLQGHSITNTGCPGANAGISDEESAFDVITVKNGEVSGYDVGVFLLPSTRVSVLGVTAHDNAVVGIFAGAQGLVKASEVYNNAIGILIQGDRGQVQQCNAHHNGAFGIIAESNNCLLTMNLANSNGNTGIETQFSSKCTISYNTASDNGTAGIDAGKLGGGSGYLVTQNTALNNGSVDYEVNCPSDVTNNTSTLGFPASYDLGGTGCHTVNNN